MAVDIFFAVGYAVAGVLVHLAQEWDSYFSDDNDPFDAKQTYYSVVACIVSIPCSNVYIILCTTGIYTSIIATQVMCTIANACIMSTYNYIATI